MPSKNISGINGFLFIFFIVTTSCQRPHAPESGEIIQLAASTECFVGVTIPLGNKGDNQFLLSAAYTPLSPGLHLYCKEMPKKGVPGRQAIEASINSEDPLSMTAFEGIYLIRQIWMNGDGQTGKNSNLRLFRSITN